jgi:hypothetical protein
VVRRGKTENTYTILARKTEVETLPGRSKRRWEEILTWNASLTSRVWEYGVDSTGSDRI